MATVAKSSPVYRGQAIYGRAFLPAYDGLVYGFNSPYLCRCPLSRLVAHYDAHLSGRHLDVGVASGRVLDEAHFPTATPELTLMDLNPNSLRTAATPLARESSGPASIHLGDEAVVPASAALVDGRGRGHWLAADDLHSRSPPSSSWDPGLWKSFHQWKSI